MGRVTDYEFELAEAASCMSNMDKYRRKEEKKVENHTGVVSSKKSKWRN